MSDPHQGFAVLRDSLTRSDSRFTTRIPDHWRQGRTAYGGVTTALALAVARDSFPDLPALRSMLVSFTGPVLADPVFIPECLRQGKSVTTVQIRVESEGRVAAQIILTFARNRDSRLSVSGDVHPLEFPPQQYERFVPREFESLAPKFVANFDTRLVAGHRSASGANQGFARVATRHIDPNSRGSIESLVAIADVLPPASLCMAATPAPVSSMTWMMNLLTDQPTTDDGWWQIESRLTTADNGYSSQQMKIWALDGRPIAEGMQYVAQFF